MIRSGWYDLVENEFRNLIDQVIVAAMGPPGGGRNDITPRMMRHFNLLCFPEFDDKTLRKIFGTIVNWFFTTAYVTTFYTHRMTAVM